MLYGEPFLPPTDIYPADGGMCSLTKLNPNKCIQWSLILKIFSLRQFVLYKIQYNSIR